MTVIYNSLMITCCIWAGILNDLTHQVDRPKSDIMTFSTVNQNLWNFVCKAKNSCQVTSTEKWKAGFNDMRDILFGLRKFQLRYWLNFKSYPMHVKFCDNTVSL